MDRVGPIARGAIVARGVIVARASVSFRPDLVDCWVFRRPQDDAPARAVDSAGTDLEILLLRRSPGRILPGFWQCVSGSLEPDERVSAGALRELVEETGIGPESIEAFYDLDLVNQFHEPTYDAIVSSAVFAVRTRPGVEPALSHEHDHARWLSVERALDAAVWPGYREAIRRIAENLADPARAGWFELTLSGERVTR